MQFLWRAILLNALGALLMTIYLLINHRADVTYRLVEMPGWVPFWPLMTIPYLLMLISPWVLAYFIKDQRLFNQYLVSVTLSFFVIAGIWYFHPTEMTRPPTPEGWQFEVHRRLTAIDNPVNIVPCGHVMTPIAIIWLLAIERPKWLVWMLPVFALGILSIVTTWQHRPVDVLTGSLISLCSVIIVRKSFSKSISIPAS